MQLPETLLRRLLIGAASLLLAALPSDAADAKPKSKPKSASETKADPTAPSAGTGLTAFGRQIPAQRPNRGVYIPSFSEGKASSIVEADVLTRIDDTRLLAETMTIHLYGDTPKDNVVVTMPTAIYNMTNQILRSDDRSKVTNVDYEIEGDALIFDTSTSQGRMTGNVRMTIHDAGSLLKKPADTQKKAPAAATETSVPKAIPVNPSPAPQPAPPSQAKPQP
jgi:lipopolysaccharide export system protein LptA